MLKIEFKKQKNKPSILTCYRQDGTYTWTKLYQGFEDHDLAHVAIEIVLEFENAFFGLIKKGFAINEYELPKNVKPDELQSYNLPDEALQTEHLVNLLQTEFRNGKIIPNLLEIYANILTEHNIPFPKKLNQRNLSEIRLAYQAHIKKWKEIKPEEQLIFIFD